MTPAMPARACVIVALGAAVPHGALAAGFYMDASISQSSVGGVSRSGLDAAMIEVGEESFDSAPSLALDARAGAYFSRTKVTVFASDGATTETDSLGSDDDTSLLLGVGATWRLAGNLALRLGYTRFDKAVAGEGDADNLSLGIRVLF